MNTILRKNGRFEIGLLWKYDNVELPNNFKMAMRRLECQENKLQTNPVLRENINKQLTDFISKGSIRKLKPEEIHVNDPRTVYLSLFHHLDLKKPEKVRLVWDGAAVYSYWWRYPGNVPPNNGEGTRSEFSKIFMEIWE